MDLTRRLLAVCLCVWGTAAAWASTDAPLPQAPSLVNSGFEDGLAGWAQDAWRSKPADVRFAADASTHHTGAAAAMLQHPHPNDSRLSQPIQVAARRLYHIWAWVKTDQVRAAEAGTIGANLSILDTRIVSNSLSGTRDWQRVELWVQNGREPTTILLACRLGYAGSTVTGTAWFDDVSIEVVATPPPAGTTLQPLDVNAGLFHRGSWGYWGLLASLIAAVAWLDAPSPRRWPACSSAALERPGAVFLLTAVGYALSAWPWLWQPSPATHYVYLADAFLHRQLHLAALPLRLHDYVRYQGRLYVQQGPLPAVLMMPLVAVGGLHASDVPFTILIGSCNAALMWAVLRRARPDASPADRGWLILLLAFGTPHWYLSVMGRVWHAASVCALTGLLLAVRETLVGRRAWVAGMWLGLAMLARASLVAAVPFFLLQIARGSAPRRAALARIAEFCTPLAVSSLVWMTYNAARFGHPMETGFSYLSESPTLYAEGMRYGLFHLRFMPRNFWYAVLNGFRLQPSAPFVAPDPFGNGIFFVTPALLYIFRGDALSRSYLPLWAGVGSIFLLLMCYMWTGWTQFGYRYLLDAMPFLLLLTQAGMGRRLSRCARASIAASIAMNWIGLRWFQARY